MVEIEYCDFIDFKNCRNSKFPLHQQYIEYTRKAEETKMTSALALPYYDEDVTWA